MKMKKARRGSLFITEDFLAFGAAKAVAKVLESMVDQEAMDWAARCNGPPMRKALKKPHQTKEWLNIPDATTRNFYDQIAVKRACRHLP